MNAMLVFLCLFIVSAIPHPVSAQKGRLPDQLFFRHLSVDEGLSQPTVNAILRGSRGFVWFATEDGLNQYDGNQFKIFRRSDNDSSTISHNVIYALLEDELTANLWVGTANGLNYYDRSLERFTRIKAADRSGSIYKGLKLDKNRNRIWIANGLGGLRYLDLTTHRIHDVDHPALRNRTVWTIALKNDLVYAGTVGDGLKIYNPATHEVTTYNEQSNPALHNVIRSLYADSLHLWIGTQGKGLQVLELATHRLKEYPYFDLNGETDIWSIAIDPKKNIWLGTDGGGLIICSEKEKGCRSYVYSPTDNQSLSANTIRSIFIEPEGHAWLGTFQNGVNYHVALPIQFKLFQKEGTSHRSLSDNAVTAFAETTDGRLWIGTGDGLNYMENEVLNTATILNDPDKTDVVLSLCADREGGLWIGTYQNGLLHKERNGKITHYRHDPGDSTSLSDNSVWAIGEDPEGFVWLGTDIGLNRFDRKTRKFHHNNNRPGGRIGDLFENTLPVRSILFAEDGTIWVGCFGALQAYNKATDKFISFADITDGGDHIKNISVVALREDKFNKLWIGTYGDGLCRLDPVTSAFKIINEDDGLINNFVLAIEHDQQGCLWMSTNKGLVRYDPVKEVFTAFDEHHGIQSYTFSRGASYRNRDGELLFGGVRGFNLFKPVKFEFSESDLDIVFTEFTIFNRVIRPGNAILPKSITEVNSITLPYHDSRLIGFTFSALNFISPAQIKYTYKLENFSEEWQPVGKDQTVTFTNLEPGLYRLIVRASFNKKTWSPEKVLSIRIYPPWYRTFAARAGVVILLGGILMGFYRWRTKDLKKQKQRLELVVDQQSQEIKTRNQELAFHNEELRLRNEEMTTQKETISDQNEMLQEAHQKLQEINQSLEILVAERTHSLDETIQKLNKTIKELDAFVYSASHDLSSPLKSILGLINLSRTHSRPDAELSEYLNYMEASIRKLEEVIGSLVEYSRNSRLEIKKETILIRNEIENCIADFRYMPESAGIQFNVLIDAEEVVISDRQRLRIILSNLLGNAIKYRDPAKSRHEVTVKVEHDKSMWKLQVYDNGIGIDKKYLGRIFEMFYRATERSQGSGLGLFIVRETVDKLNGTISVDSEKGHWTKFELTLPYEF